MARQVHIPAERRKAWVCRDILSQLRGKNMKNLMKRLWREEEGQDLVEYGLLVVLIGLFCITAMKGLASDISNVFTNAGSSLAGQS